MKRVVVIGGGISGLACARAIAEEAKAKDERVEITVLESSARFGGNVSTEREGEFVLDGGPDSWVTNKPEATALAKSLGLEDQFLSTKTENRKVYIVHAGRLHPMPEGLVLGIPTRILPIAKTPLFSASAKARMAFEPFVGTGDFTGDNDESIGSFIERRLGREVADRLVGPLLGGIFAGDAGTISVRAAFPQLVEAERKYGSLLKAVRAQKRASANPTAFISLKGGMSALVDALVGDLEKRDGVTLMKNAPVKKLACDADEWIVELSDGTHLRAPVVVVATPVHAAAKIVGAIDA